MIKDPALNEPEFRTAFLANEQQERLSTGKVASALVVFLMPAGILLDFFVYREHMGLFLLLRLICSVLAGVIWFLHTREFAKNYYRVLGLPIALLPAFFIAWMIHITDGPISPYYAGLNLILLSVSVVVHWSTLESFLAVFSVLLIYFVACLLKGTKGQLPIIFNNFYFLGLTGVIVITGNYFFNRLRFREFSLRHELDKNRKALEASLSQLKDNEMQLVQSEKLASLGRMSAGIIHEINNPLNYATTGLYTLRNKAKYLAEEQREDYAEVLRDVEEGVKRVKTIVSDLRTFSHPDAGHCEQVPVTDALAAALRFLSNEWRDLVQIDLQIEPQLTVNANRNQLVQVLMNLLQNSLDAMKTKTFTDEKPTIQITGRVEGEVSRLCIRDNGPGIPGQHLDKIFDPFYTTKDVGEGMGLGLSICHRIIKESGGKISVKTEPGRFCEFTLEFSARKWDKSEGS